MKNADARSVPENVYVCVHGHVTEADITDEAVRALLGEKHEFDYTKRCRRRLPHPYRADQGPPRCGAPVVPAKKFPELYSTFLLGGESAVAEIVIKVTYGFAPET